MKKQAIIAGNWKMNNTKAEAKTLIDELKPLIDGAEAEVVLCVPFTGIEFVAAQVKGTKIKVGAQNLSWADKGAFTGEISADMLKEAGAEYVIIGHSERRQYFGETDSTVNTKALKALEKGLKPIICVGESLEQREKGKTNALLKKQVRAAYNGLTADDAVRTVVAYEPIWAIGTGKTATADEAQETIAFIRNTLRLLYGKRVSDKVRIQYGGSMNASNAKSLMEKPDIDGGLIGGASLKAADFSKIVKYDT